MTAARSVEEQILDALLARSGRGERWPVDQRDLDAISDVLAPMRAELRDLRRRVRAAETIHYQEARLHDLRTMARSIAESLASQLAQFPEPSNTRSG